MDQVGPSHSTEATQRLVNQHDYCKQNHPGDERRTWFVGGHTLQQQSHCGELREQIIADGDYHRDRGEHRIRAVAETVLQKICWSDEALSLGQAMQPWGKHKVHHDDRCHKMHTHQPGVADAERLACECKQRVATVLRCVEREHQNKKTDP